MDSMYDELFGRYHEAASGRERIAILDEVARLADANNDIDVAYQIRRQLTRDAVGEGYPEKAIVAFSWCMSQFDKEPEIDDWHGVLWQYKTILELIPVFSTVSRQQVIGMQDDMARRLVEFGESERTAHYYRSWNFMRMGDYDEALKFHELYTSMPRTSMSDCEACERDRQVELFCRVHRDEESLKLAVPIMSGRMRCNEVPEFTNAHIAKSQLRLGQVDEATERQKAGYKSVRQDRKYLGTIGDLLLVIIHNRDLDTGMNQVVRHLPWAVETAAGELRFRFYQSAALFFEALSQESPESKKIRLPKELECWREDDQYVPAELADWFHAESKQLASEFNSRNGNTTCDRWLADSRELARL